MFSFQQQAHIASSIPPTTLGSGIGQISGNFGPRCAGLVSKKKNNNSRLFPINAGLIPTNLAPPWVILLFFFGPHQGELPYPVHHMVLETKPRNQGSEVSGATMLPQMTVVADLTRSED